MTESESPNSPRNGLLEQYKSYLQDVGNIGSRHETSRRFYMSVVSALFVFLSMTGEGGAFLNVRSSVQEVVGIVGIVLCIIWIMHMQSFAAIYKAKFRVLGEIEKEDELFPIFGCEGSEGREWAHLKSDSRYRCLTLIDSVMPIVLASLFVLIMFMK